MPLLRRPGGMLTQPLTVAVDVDRAAWMPCLLRSGGPVTLSLTLTFLVLCCLSDGCWMAGSDGEQWGCGRPRPRYLRAGFGSRVRLPERIRGGRVVGLGSPSNPQCWRGRGLPDVWTSIPHLRPHFGPHFDGLPAAPRGLHQPHPNASARGAAQLSRTPSMCPFGAWWPDTLGRSAHSLERRRHDYEHQY